MVTPRCACGYTKFATRVERAVETLANRWRPVPVLGGLGSSPLGVTLATGQQGWGRFTLPVVRGVASTYCMSCRRPRRGIPVGGGTVMASYADGGAVYAVMTDVVQPSCVSAQFTLVNGESYPSLVQVLDDALPALVGSPLEVREAMPQGAIAADRLYRIPVPSVRDAGLYRVVLIDKCLELKQSLGSLILEGNLDLYGRTGDVVAEFGDYSSSQIATAEDDITLDEQLGMLQQGLYGKALVAGDLGGTAQSPKVTRLQGRPVRDVTPPDGTRLRWSAENGRWEPG